MPDATQTVVNQVGYNPEVASYLKENLGQARALTYNYKMGPDGKPIIGANGMPEIESFRDPEKYGGQVPVMAPSFTTQTEVMEMVAGKRPNPNKYTISDAVALGKNPNDPKYAKKNEDGTPVMAPKMDAEGKPVTEFKGYERQAEFSDLQKQAMQGARDMATTKYDAAGKAIPTANESAQSIMKNAADTAAKSSYIKSTAGNQYTAPKELGYTAKDAKSQQAGIATLPTGETATAATMGKAPTGIAAIGQAQQDQMAPEMAAQTGTAATGIAALNKATPQMTAQRAEAATLGAAPEALSTQFAGPRDINAERVGAERINAPALRDMSMTAAKDIAGSTVESRDIKAAQTGYNPNLTANQMGNVADVTSRDLQSRDIKAAKESGLASLKNYQMGAAERVGSRDVTADTITAAQMGPAERVETKSFAQPGSADAYMSPYMQSVVGIQQREAQRAADVASTGRRGEQTRAGAFGGSRAAIMDAEAARNLATQQGDIQAQGLQAAYQQAQQQFNTEQAQGLQAQTANQQAGLTTGQQNLNAQQQTNVQNAANKLQAQGMSSSQAMQAALANQQAGLTVGQQNLAANLGVQQLGEGQINLQTKLANLNNEQQAAVQNEANRLQTQGMSSSQAMQAALANQQAGLTIGQQNLSARQGTQQLNTQTESQMALANLSNQQQTAVQNEANRLQAQGLTAGQAMQAALANQGVQQQANLQNLSAGLQTQGLSAQTGLQAQQANQQYNMQGQLANQQSNLTAQQANQGMGYNTAMQNAQLQQQTALANQGQRGQYGLQQGQLNQAANLQTSAQAQEAQRQNQALAGQYGLSDTSNQQQANLTNAGYLQQTGMANLANQQEAQRQNQASNSQYGLANLANRQQAEMTNAGYRQQTGMADQALAGQYGMQQGTMDQQAAMQTAANRQQAEMYGAQAQNERAQYNTSNQQQAELANQAAENRASEFGLGQKLTSAGTSAQYGQAANQLNEQSGQFGANLGLQGQQAAMQGATGLSNIAGQGFNQGVQTNQMLSAYGNQQQGAEQQRLNTQYQDFLNEQNDPYKKLGFMANTASAAPTADLGSTIYKAAPSAFNQIAGLGTAAAGAGAFGSFNKANGGMVGRYAKGGLVRSRPQGLVALAIHSMA